MELVIAAAIGVAAAALAHPAARAAERYLQRTGAPSYAAG